MKKLFFIFWLVVLTLFCAFHSSTATTFVKLTDCDFNENKRVDRIDLLTMVAKAPKVSFDIRGKPIYKMPSQPGLFDPGVAGHAIVFHGFVSSVVWRATLIDSEELSIEVGKSHPIPSDAMLNEIRINWSRWLQDGQTMQFVCILFTFADDAPSAEDIQEMEEALLCPSDKFLDPSGNGELDTMDVAIISKFLPPPVRSDYDPMVEESILRMSQDDAENGIFYLRAEGYELLPIAVEPVGKIATTWGSIRKCAF